MAENQVRVSMKRIAVCVVLLCFLHLTVPVTATNTQQCGEKVKRCTCHYGESEEVGVDNGGGEYDHRSVGLAGATGALGGILAAGSAVAAYFHFRGTRGENFGGKGGGGSGGGGGEGGGGGGGEGEPRGGKDGKYPARPDSSGSSNQSYGSQSPLTKRDSGYGKTVPSRHRPFTGASSTSNATNIYRHAKVWPGRFGQ
ncbi:hypothetical protein V1264_018226 [Littorina saxatilis]|uniref:Uncharacterized protein n=1 Tax=Littorina saxatilis TaxID=31220 RepID=A0AAN9BD02_9CAEN